MASKNSVNIIKQNIEEKLTRYFGVVPADATQDQLYKAVSMTVVDILLEEKRQFNAKMKEQMTDVLKGFYEEFKDDVKFNTIFNI